MLYCIVLTLAALRRLIKCCVIIFIISIIIISIIIIIINISTDSMITGAMYF